MAPAFELYGLGLEHKHVPELQKYAKLTRRPLFVPSVGNFRQGMLVSVPLHLDTLPGKPTAGDLEAVLDPLLRRRQAREVVPAGDPAAKAAVSSPRASMAPMCSSCASSPTPSTARRCWSRGSTTWARAPRAQPCRTSA